MMGKAGRYIAGILVMAWLLFAAGTAYAFDLPLTLPGAREANVQKELPLVLPETSAVSVRETRQGSVLYDTALKALPEKDAPETGTVWVGDVLDVYSLNVNGEWDAVMTADGVMAYIPASALSLTAPTMQAADSLDPLLTDGGEGGYPGLVYNDGKYLRLLAEAKKYIGYPYVWGGSTPETSFDCSGFVCWALNETGLAEVGRTDAQGLHDLSTEISKEEARPGDLVFFQGTYDTPNTVTHVAIYIGNGYMLHAGKPIGYSSMETDYWQAHFYAFGRLI